MRNFVTSPTCMPDRLNHALIGAIILAASLAGIWLGLSLSAPAAPGPAPQERAVAEPGPHPTPVRTQAAASAQAGRPTQAVVVTEALGAAMLAQYNTSPNYRAFVYQAMKDPEHGGYSYSSYVLGVCGRALAEHKGVSSEAQRAALATLRARCNMSKSEHEQMEHDLMLAQFKEPGKDPLEKATRASLLTESTAERRASLARVLEFQLASPALVLAAVPIAEGKGLYFQGKYYDTEHSTQLYAAAGIAGCSLGGDCSASSPAALMLCINRGWCGSDQPSEMRAGNPEEFAQIQALSQQIVLAIKRRDAMAFVPGV